MGIVNFEYKGLSFQIEEETKTLIKKEGSDFQKGRVSWSGDSRINGVEICLFEPTQFKELQSFLTSNSIPFYGFEDNNHSLVIELPDDIVTKLLADRHERFFPYQEIKVSGEIVEEGKRYLILELPTHGGEQYLLRHIPKEIGVSVAGKGDANSWDKDYLGEEKIVSIIASECAKDDYGDRQIQVSEVTWSDGKSYSIDCKILPIVPIGPDKRTNFEKTQIEYDQTIEHLLSGLADSGGDFWRLPELTEKDWSNVTYRPDKGWGDFSSDLYKAEHPRFGTVYRERFGNVYSLRASREAVEYAWLSYVNERPQTRTPEDSYKFNKEFGFPSWWERYNLYTLTLTKLQANRENLPEKLYCQLFSLVGKEPQRSEVEFLDYIAKSIGRDTVEQYKEAVLACVYIEQRPDPKYNGCVGAQFHDWNARRGGYRPQGEQPCP